MISPLLLCIIVFSASVSSLGNKIYKLYLTLNPFVGLAVSVEGLLAFLQVSHRASLLLLSQIPLGVSKGRWENDLLKSYYQVNSRTANNIHVE